MRSRFALALVCALTVMLIVALTAVARDSQPLVPHPSSAVDFVKGEVLLKLRLGTTLSAVPRSSLRSNSTALSERLSQVAARTATTVFAGTRNADLQRIYRLEIDPGQDVMTAIRILEADPNVEYAEPNYLARAAVAPNDPLYSSQWALDKINAPAAWNIVTGTPSIVIALIDSGIDTTHPDLAGKLWINPGEIPGNGIDDDNDGYIDDVNGWNFVDNNNNIADDNGHGTQVAGVAGASTNNAIGIAGMCWNCRLMIVKAMQASGVANYSDIAAAVNYAAAKGAQVINISLGGYADSATLRAAIDAASNTAVIVGGAGNDNASTPFYPAAYSGVLAVASTTMSDSKASFSNYGSWVDIAAPGVAISTTFSGGDYGTSEGTSLSAPLVAGLAGLIKSAHPDWSAALVQAQIVHTTDAITATQLGSGRVNAATAMLPPRPLFSVAGYTLNGTPSGRPELNSSNALIVGVSNDWFDATNVVGTLSESDPFVTVVTGTASFGDIASGAAQSSAPFSFTVASGAGYNHPIAFTLNLAANGGAYTATLPFTITTRSGEEPVAGTIAVDTLWTNDKTYVVNGNIGIAPGVTLTIQPGTAIQFNGNYSFNVGGTLIANGTAAQPIRFESKTGGLWGQIGFTDSSTDTSVDADYDYVSGSIMQYVVVDKANNGVRCNSATPYLSHVTLSSGQWQLICAPGDLRVGASVLPGIALVLDSYVSGGIIISGTGNAYLWRNTVSGGVVGFGQVSVLTNTVTSGGVQVGAGSEIQDSVITGAVNINGAGNIIGNAIIRGGVSIGTWSAPSIVLSNTIKGGGISFSHAGMEIRGNDIENAAGWGILGTYITGTDQLTITHNRLIDNANGIQLGVNWGNPLVQNNLIANNSSIGLQLTIGTILSNTFVGNRGSAIQIMNSAGLPDIHGNNFEGNLGAYDIENLHTGSGNFIQAQNNWWGTTNTVAIANRIYDFGDDFNLAIVQYQPLLNSPVQDAPAYVRKVTVLPDSTLGIQTGTFEAEFSRPMDTSDLPEIYFYDTKRGWLETVSALSPTINSSIANDALRQVWYGGNQGGSGACPGLSRYNGSTWVTFLASQSGLLDNCITSLFGATNGDLWIGYPGGMVSRVRGVAWTSYTPVSTGGVLTYTSNYITNIRQDNAGNIWLGGDGLGVVRFNGITWRRYTTADGLADNAARPIGVDGQGRMWFLTNQGLSVFDGTHWTTYDQSAGLPTNSLTAAYADREGRIWVGLVSGYTDYLMMFDGATWTGYGPANTGGVLNHLIDAIAQDVDGSIWLAGNQIGQPLIVFDSKSWKPRTDLNVGNLQGVPILFDSDNNLWIGSGMSSSVVQVLWGGLNHFASQATSWLDSTHYRATYDISALIPRGTYSITVNSATSFDGIAIAPNSANTFTVDYAGGVVDTTPPPAPSLSVDFCANSTTSVAASWFASDPNSAITLYRYALGSAINGVDVLNWTDTGSTSVTRTGLNLVAGQHYYFSVKARNAGGLWSETTSRGFTAGVPCQKVYLPLVRK